MFPWLEETQSRSSLENRSIKPEIKLCMKKMQRWYFRKIMAACSLFLGIDSSGGIVSAIKLILVRKKRVYSVPLSNKVGTDWRML
jgi:hypothetical protein